MTKKHIIIFPGYYPPHVGGMETVAAEQAKYLSESYNVTVFAPRLPKITSEYEIVEGVRIYRYPAFEIVKNYPLPKLWSPKYWSIKKKINADSFDLAITHTRFFYNSLLGVFFSKKKNIKLFHVEHGGAFVKTSSASISSISKIYDLTIGKFVLNSANQVIAISQQVKKFIRNDLCIKNDIKVIYRGLELNKIDKITKQRFTNNKINLITVARLAKCKGIDNAVTAIKSLSPNVKSCIHYHIIGSGIEKRVLIKLADNDQSITFHGQLSNSQTISMLKGADVYIHPSNPGGGLATTLLEAMYCRNFIIASPNEGAAEIIDAQVGFLIDDNSPQEIKKAIEQSLRLKNLDKIKENGKKRVKSCFNWSDKIKQIEEEILTHA